MKKLLSVLLSLTFVASTSFAGSGWEGIAIIAVTTSAAILGLMYGLGIASGSNEIQMMAKEELYQLVATGILIALLLGSNGLLDGISKGLAKDQSSQNIQLLSMSIIDDTLKAPGYGVETIYNAVKTDGQQVEIEGSKMLSCSVVGVGYSVSACGGYSMLAAPFSMGGSIVGFTIGELYSMKRLIAIVSSYAMTLLLPIGILLRTFKATRGAGGFLIALAISAYVLLPIGIIFNQMLADTFAADASSSKYTKAMSTTITECDPDDALITLGNGEDQKAINVYDSLRTDLRSILFGVLVRGTLGPIISLLVMIAGLRALTSLAGADIDVSAIGRFV